MVRFSASAGRPASAAPPRGHRAPGRCLHVVDDAPHEIGASTGHLTIVPLKLSGAQSIPPIHNAGRTAWNPHGRVVRSAGWRRAGMRSAHDLEHGIGVGYLFVLSQWCLLVDRKVRTRPRSYPQVAPQYGCTIWWRYLFEPHMFDAPTSENSPPVDRAHVTDPVGIFSQHRDQIPLAAVVSHHYRQGVRRPVRRPRTSKVMSRPRDIRPSAYCRDQNRLSNRAITPGRLPP